MGGRLTPTKKRGRAQKPSKIKRQQQLKKGPPPPHKDKLSADNIKIAGGVAGTGWAVAAILVKIPELGQAGAAATMGGMTIWAMIKDKIEKRREE